jgi:predicted homoserine dehydrogenase-like protein
VSIIDRTLQVSAEAGIEQVQTVESVERLDETIHQGQYAVTENSSLLCRAENVDALIELTSHVESGAHVAMEAIENRKHLILSNADLEGTVGPILKRYADRAGVVIANAESDQPAVEMNLYRFVKSLGLRPLVCGNIKGLQDRYRNPTTQESFARQ